jgi:hypothetical protein
MRRFIRVLKRFEPLQHIWIELEKPAVPVRGGSAAVILLDALKSPAIHRPIVIDQAAVVVAKELASPAHIRQHHLDHPLAGMVNGDIDREWPEPRMLVRLEQDSIVMPVLPAAIGGAALAARAFASSVLELK